VTVTDALEQQHAEDTATPVAGAAGKPTQTGAMRSRQVSVLGGRGRRRSHWLRHDRFWMLSAGNGTIVALAPHRDRPERWAVVQLDSHSHQLIARDVDLAYAHGIAEDHIRQLGARRLADPSAPWRRQPITDNQARTLGRLGIAVPEDATKGQASDLIATHHGAQRLHALSGQRAA
jgi:hypothetical protein